MAFSRTLGQRAARRGRVLSDALQGRMPSLLRFSSGATLRRVVDNSLRLPVASEAPSDWENAFQNPVFMEGYSHPDGPDPAP